MLGSADDLSILGEWGLAVLECFLLGRGLMLALLQCGGSASWGRILEVLPATALAARCIAFVIGGAGVRTGLIHSGLLRDSWIILMWFIAFVLLVLPARNTNRGPIDGEHAPH